MNKPTTAEGDPASFDLSGSIGTLVQGDYILAIHGMNSTIGSSDFMVAPILSESINQIPEPQGLTFLGLAALLALGRSRK